MTWVLNQSELGCWSLESWIVGNNFKRLQIFKNLSFTSLQSKHQQTFYMGKSMLAFWFNYHEVCLLSIGDHTDLNVNFKFEIFLWKKDDLSIIQVEIWLIFSCLIMSWNTLVVQITVKWSWNTNLNMTLTLMGMKNKRKSSMEICCTLFSMYLPIYALKTLLFIPLGKW